LTSENTYIKIAFAEPTSNHVAIDYYQILIEKSDGSFIVDSHCDGADSTTITNKYCLVPMTTLRATPFDLTF